MVTKEAVDISHPAVKELMNAGYSEAESIRAIEKCEEPEKAVEYLISTHSGISPADASSITAEENSSQ